ncbi:MAG: hypothetical protein Q4E61_01740 [Alphaproteobacteria bacterium]|nr:hypothetical protein [Alphaproteobacteria bacterium]
MHVVANPNDVSVLKNKVFESSTAKPDKVLEKKIPFLVQRLQKLWQLKSKCESNIKQMG